MGTLNFHNLAARAQELLDTVDPDDLDEDTFDGLIEAAAGILPPGVTPSTTLPPERTPPHQSRVREDADPRRTDSPSPAAHTPQEVTQQVPQEVPSSQQEVTAPESDETSYHFLKKSKRCAAQNKKSGAPCRAWATFTGYCVYHDPDYAETLREMQSRGGSRSPRQVLVGEAKRLNINVMEPGGIQALLANSYRLNLLGALTSRQASQLNRLLTLIVSNARNMPANDAQASAFEGNNTALLAFTDKAIQHLEGRDLTDRINAIQDVGSKREEILKANDRFGPRPSYRSARDFGY